MKGQAKEYSKIIDSFKGKKTLIVGDVMIDNYLIGQMERISPESPVPIVDITYQENRLGGAGNVALNMKLLGAEPILCSIMGNDDQRQVISSLLSKRGISESGIHYSNQRTTTVKTRILSRNQQILRFDKEVKHFLNDRDEEALLDILGIQINQGPDVIVIQDYNKGILTEKIIDFIISTANKMEIPVAVDPKKTHFAKYNGVTLFKPNLTELTEGLKIDKSIETDDDLHQLAERLRIEMPHKISMITLSEKGLYISSGNDEFHVIPSKIRNVADVSGAGDTVISIAALCLANNTDLYSLAYLSNLGGGLVCEEAGVVPLTREKLLQAVSV